MRASAPHGRGRPRPQPLPRRRQPGRPARSAPGDGMRSAHEEGTRDGFDLRRPDVTHLTASPAPDRYGSLISGGEETDMANRKAKDLDPKAKAKKVRGGHSLWNDNKGKLPLRLGKTADRVAVEPVKGSGDTTRKIIRPS